jgi:transposase-like protein
VLVAKRSKSETERFYRRLVAEQERSGSTARAFAEARGIPPGTLSFWRYELKRRDQARAEAASARPVPSFLPVSVVESSPTAPASSASAPERTEGYEVVLGGDRVLRLPRDFDDVRVAALVRAVASC